MREPVVILPPDRAGDEDIERGNLGPPGELMTDRQPFGVLIKHRVDDVGEGLIST
jgi:hypothetical protein